MLMDSIDCAAQHKLHVELTQELRCSVRHARRQRGKDARATLHNRYVYVASVVSAVEAEVSKYPRCLLELSGKLHAGCSSADNDNLHRAGNASPRMLIAFCTLAQEPATKPLGLPDRVERYRMLLSARNAEKVRGAANRQHQGVVFNFTSDVGSLFVFVETRDSVQDDGLSTAVQPDEFALHETEMMPVRLCGVCQLIGGWVQATGCHFMQERLPEVRSAPVYQSHTHSTLLPKLVTKLGRQFQATCASAYDYNSMHGFLFDSVAAHTISGHINSSASAPRPRSERVRSLKRRPFTASSYKKLGVREARLMISTRRSVSDSPTCWLGHHVGVKS